MNSKYSYQPIPGEEGDIEILSLPPKENASREKSSKKFPLLGYLVLLGASILLIGGYFAATSREELVASGTGIFDERNRYILRNFDQTRPMSNFLHGLAGVWGIPMWAFYVNRGQAITSFGKQNKDSAMEKFVTAEKAYLQTPFTGFRTFLKGTKNGESWNHMPFFPDSSQESERNMMIGLNELEIEEISPKHQLRTNILYFIAPEQDFPSLVRSSTFTNLDPNNDLEIEILDGLAQIIPNGLGNNAIDSMGRTMEAWMNVYNVGNTQGTNTKITQPFYHISQGTADTAQVQIVKDGFFAMAYIDGKSSGAVSTERDLLPFVVDPTVVFRFDTTLTNPSGFFATEANVDELLSGPQGTTSRTPCAYAGARLRIPAGGNITITSVYGYAENLETLTGKYAPVVLRPDYTETKRFMANEMVEKITEKVATKTAWGVFDAYVRQDFLDNFLRGGLPLLLGSGSSSKVFHVFSRIHGDIERDYNYFQIDTTYFSQGPGNFRDVCQNRRLDVSHSPFVEDFNIRLFLSFVQADGFNPLTIASTLFKIPSEILDTVLTELHIQEIVGSTAKRSLTKAILSKPFRPGQFFKDAAAAAIEFDIPKEDVLARLISYSNQDFAGQFSQNGYWSDHWTYILDLVDNYLTVYPDKESHLLWDSQPIPFFMSPAIVKPRELRLLPVDNPAKPGSSIARAFNPINVWGEAQFNQEKMNAMNLIFQDPNYLVDSNGAGNVWQRAKDQSVFRVSVLGKLLMLGILKFSTMDPYGMGIEMEGGKPGWNDAMNGLPGLLGSGMPETYEMLRILRYCRTALESYNRPVEFPVEFATFFAQVISALDIYFKSPQAPQDDVAYWDATATARESYRAAVVAYFEGNRQALPASYVISAIEKMESKVEKGISKALATGTGLSPTYFYYDCTDFSLSTVGSELHLKPNSFVQRTLPLFLEGPTRHLKVISDIEERRRVYQLVKSSPLYDVGLKMYTICESLASMGQDVGRMKAFSPGWLENQSVWLHMSYKYYLELLRGGLYEEFFEEISTGLVPFMNNDIYGRSPLEAASFIVSSAFPDSKLHGASFLARLSGSTAEFLSMWQFMMTGPSPFVKNEFGEVQLQLRPVLPGNIFDQNNSVSFTFLGQIEVSYQNPKRIDTWKTVPQSILVVKNDGSTVTIPGSVIGTEIALLVRSLQVVKIVVVF